jgi:hypothetical protein
LNNNHTLWSIIRHQVFSIKRPLDSFGFRAGDLAKDLFKELKVKDVAGGFSKKRLKHDTAVGIASEISPRLVRR